MVEEKTKKPGGEKRRGNPFPLGKVEGSWEGQGRVGKSKEWPSRKKGYFPPEIQKE